jgi:hypothetical protein
MTFLRKRLFMTVFFIAPTSAAVRRAPNVRARDIDGTLPLANSPLRSNWLLNG